MKSLIERLFGGPGRAFGRLTGGIRRVLGGLTGGFDQADACILLGVGLLAVGAWQVYRPAGLIVAGLLVLTLGLWRM